SPEDGCDEAAFHITICDKVEEGIPPLIEEPIVEPTPVQRGASEACVAAVGGIAGALLIALPLAVASQVEIPGLSAMVRDAQDRIARANSELQRNIGIYNEDLVRQANEFGIAMRPEHAQWLGAGAASVALFGVVATMLAPCVPGDATGVAPVMSAVPEMSATPADPAAAPDAPVVPAAPVAPADPAVAPVA
ncbi:hypothetical protein, partial [Corynebacterium sp. LK2510]|uniref:hypothetical protein n=1 Tax=Corynebacterium sp. LK2510 TaxID=3110472 RepID=UPI0034D0BD2D